jgi:sulfur-oxidizing protein SoxY
MRTFGLIAAMTCLTALPAFAAGEMWEDISAELFGDRILKNGDNVIAIDAPYRTYDDARTELAAQVIAPRGLYIGKVTVVLDDNPMPVSAIFEMERPQTSFYFDITMRVNGPTPMHVIAETTDGQLFVSETFVKTSGQGACSAPPGTDAEIALATLGNMAVDLVGTVPFAGTDALTNRMNRMDVDISHPSHSGMQMDQISLLFLPMRYVENVEIDLDGAGYIDMTGSISLSENPKVGLSVPMKSRAVDVTMTDTDGTVSHIHKDLAGF